MYPDQNQFGFDPRDPRVQAMMAQRMRGMQQPGQMPPQMQPPQQQQPAPAIQAPLQGGPPPMAPQGMPPQGGPPMGGGLDPDMIEQMLALQGQAGQRDAMKRQYALANALRGDAQKQVQSNVSKASTGGSLVTAPSWLNGAVAVGQNLMAAKRERDADATGAGLDSQRQAAAKNFLAAMSSQSRKRKPDDEDTFGGY